VLHGHAAAQRGDAVDGRSEMVSAWSKNQFSPSSGMSR
jgi:hypothetical protein